MNQNRQMNESIDFSVCISIAFEWSLLGEVSVDGEGKLKFPKAPRCPGLYRFRLESPSVDRDRVYIGETKELTRRFRHYRTPGISQKTNDEMNKLLLDHLTKDKGEVATVFIATEGIKLTFADESIEYFVDMANKYLRRLLENSALVNEETSGAELLNR